MSKYNIYKAHKINFKIVQLDYILLVMGLNNLSTLFYQSFVQLLVLFSPSFLTYI